MGDKKDNFWPKNFPSYGIRTWSTATNSKGVQSVPLTAERIKETFKRYDLDMDGRLSREELTNAFTSLGSRFPWLRTLLAMAKVDTNGDGYITADEFEGLVSYALKLGYTYK